MIKKRDELRVKDKENRVEFRPEEFAVKESVEFLPPQAIAYNKLKAFFEKDSLVNISSLLPDTKHEGEYIVEISSSDYHKLVALSKVLKDKIDNLNIKFIYHDEDNEYFRTIQDAFSGNGYLDNIRVATESFSGTKHVVTTFKDEVIQYGADSRFVPNGYNTTLMQDLVQELFNDDYLMSVYVTKEKTPGICCGASLYLPFEQNQRLCILDKR